MRVRDTARVLNRWASATSISGSSPTVTTKRTFGVLSVRTVEGAFTGKGLAACRASHADDNFTLSVSLLQIPDGLWDLGERKSPVDERCELAGFDEFLED